MADRRRAQASSSSDTRPMSPTFLQDAVANMQLLSSLETTAKPTVAPDPPTIEQELGRMLSVHSVVSTSSSEARRQAAAALSPAVTFSKVGAGSCGAIFARDGQATVIKLAKRGYMGDLWNDYRIHSIVAQAMKEYGSLTSITVPACEGFVGKEAAAFWQDNQALVEAAKTVVELPTAAIVSERIFPLPKPVRVHLIEKYCAERGKKKALEDPANKDCLVRPYLGSLQGRSGGMFFSLRNFKLHLNQMLELQLNVGIMAKDMAAALAIVHWVARTDARDVEFVLGSSAKRVPARSKHPNLAEMPAPDPTTVIGPESTEITDFAQRTTTLWLLDFNQVKKITADEAGVAEAVNAHMLNDPYYPKPFQKDSEAAKVWDQFVESYLGTSEKILGSTELPTMFIDGIMEKYKNKLQQ